MACPVDRLAGSERATVRGESDVGGKRCVGGDHRIGSKRRVCAAVDKLGGCAVRARGAHSQRWPSRLKEGRGRIVYRIEQGQIIVGLQRPPDSAQGPRVER